MRVKFKYIEIHNYKSIIKASLNYTQGVWLVSGVNNDAFGSNGAGKSTLLEALQQCLYNRTTKGTTLDTTINRITGQAYKLIVELETEHGIYKIVNDRTAMRVTIYDYINGEFVDRGIKSVPVALAAIQDIIGLDFNSFIALTHITHNTVISMTDNLSHSNLIKVLLDFGLLARLEKKSKQYLSQSHKDYEHYIVRKKEIETSLQLMESFKPIDKIPLYKELAGYTKYLEESQHEYNQISEYVMLHTTELTSKISVMESKVNDIDNLLHNDICQACGQPLPKDYDTTTLQEDRLNYINSIQEAKLSIDNITAEAKPKIDKLLAKIKEYTEATNTISTKIQVADYQESIYNSNQDSINELTAELVMIEKNIPKELFNQDTLVSVIDLLKKGTIQNNMLSEFTSIVNLYIKEYIAYVSIDYLDITTFPQKGGFEYRVLDTRHNCLISFNELSGGELTRVRLVVLLAILRTMRTMIGASINILIFDEALDTLDKEASGDLAMLFDHLVDEDDKFIGMVSHGQQLSQIEFSGELHVVKTNNITTVTQG